MLHLICLTGNASTGMDAFFCTDKNVDNVLTTGPLTPTPAPSMLGANVSTVVLITLTNKETRNNIET